MLTQKQRNDIVKSRMELMREECRDDVKDGKIVFEVKEFENYINYIIQKTIQKTEENLTKHNTDFKKPCSNCNGTKWVWDDVHKDHYKCGTCKGQGFIKS